MNVDREREVENAKQNPAYVLKGFGVMWRSIRYQPLTTPLLLMGVCAAPGAVMALISGVFFSASVPVNAPMAERMSNWVGASIVKPVGATLVVSTEAAYRAQLVNYKTVKEEKSIPLDKATMVKLTNFSKNNGVLVNFKQVTVK